MKRNFFSISFLTYTAIVIVFLTQVIIVRMLDISSYGVYAVIAAVISIIEGPLITRGGELALREAGRKWNDDRYGEAVSVINYINRNETSIFWMVYITIVIASFIFSEMIFDTDPIYLSILALSIPVQVGYGAYKNFLTITNNIRLQSYTEVLFASFTMLSVVIGILLYGLSGLLAALVLSALVKTRVSKYFYVKTLAGFGVVSDSGQSEGVIQEDFRKRSTSSMFRVLLQNGIMQVDIIILGLFQKPEVVAIYKVGKTLAGLPTKVSIPVWKYLHPAMVKAVNLRDVHLTRKTVFKGSAIVASLFALIYVAALLFGEDVVRFLYGENYTQSTTIFMILLLGYGAFYAVNGWFKTWVALIDNFYIGSAYFLCVLVGVVIVSLAFNDDIEKLSTAISMVLVAMTAASYLLSYRVKGG
jgi:O-antigen/teichoic acid export membrane protein